METAVLSLQARIDNLSKQLAVVTAGKAKEAKLRNIYRNNSSSLMSVNKKLKEKATQLEESLRAAQEEVAKLTRQHDTLQQRGNIRTMSGSPLQYTSSVRQCCIQLLAHNVGVEHVSAVIKTVITTLTSYHIERLPSPAKMCDFLGEAKQLVLTQLGEQLMATQNLTLHRDGTTKNGKKYYGAQISTADATLDLGLSQVRSGSAQHCFEAVLDMVRDIETATQNAGHSGAVFNRIITNIKNTMSDRGSVEKSCNNMLQEFRQTVMPSVVDGWSELPDDAKARLGVVNNFYCGLHFIVGLAEQAQETMRAWEKAEYASGVGAAAVGGFTTGEPGPVRLVRTVCKALEAHCNEQSGNHAQFQSFFGDAGHKHHSTGSVCREPF
eukprot:scpid18081/ scgid19491/ 